MCRDACRGVLGEVGIPEGPELWRGVTACGKGLTPLATTSPGLDRANSGQLEDSWAGEHSLCTQRSLVQLRVSRSVPWHSSPPLRGAGSEHSRFRQWVQSSPQADHLLHGLQLPSTRCKIDTDREEMARSAWGASTGSRCKAKANVGQHALWCPAGLDDTC